MGNHTANKGLDIVIRTAKTLNERITLAIGGRIKNPDLPVAWKQQLSSSPNIKLIITDNLSLAEQRALYHKPCFFYSHPYRTHCPLLSLEAMAMGSLLLHMDRLVFRSN